MGIIDDDINLKGRIIAGYTVLGGVGNLKDLVSEWRADALVITCLLSPEKQTQVVRIAESLGILVSVWACEERQLGEPSGAWSGGE